MRRTPLLALTTVLFAACLGPNPNAGSSGEGDGTGTETETTGNDESGSGSGNEETGEPDPTCTDGMHNGNETDEDCGGDCGPCEDGDMCKVPADCESKVCDGVCLAPTCEDGVQNGDEAMADCGGACEVCVLDELHDEWASPDEDLETQPAVDMLPDGRFAIAWVTVSLDVRYRWFDADAENPSDGFLASGNTVPEERSPVVRIREGMDPELVLSYIDTNINNGGPDVIMRRFDTSGAATKGPITIDVLNPLGVDGFGFDVQGGEATFAWHGGGWLLARRYDLAADDFLEMENLDVTTDLTEEAVSVAYAEDGGYLLAWTENLGDFAFDAYVRRRTPGGSWVGDAAAANAWTDGIQRLPSAALLSDGGFVVVWSGATEDDPTGGIAGRILDSTGAPVGEELQINEILEGSQEYPAVVATRTGFAVGWHDEATETVRLRRFANDGSPWYDDEAPWGSTADLQPTAPAMAANDEQLVMLWAAGSPNTEIVGVRVAP